MRRLTIRLFAICLLGAGLTQLHAGKAAACIKFDRSAEMALIDEAIASDKTSEANRAMLRALRKEIFVFRNKKAVDSEDALQHHYLTTKALALIGKERIVWRWPETPERTQRTKSVKREMAESPAVPTCG